MIGNTKRSLLFLLAMLALALGVLFVDYLGFFTEMDTLFYDLCFRLRGDRAVSDRIVIVAVDSKTLERLGRWPLKRRYYADMLGRLAQASVVGFDLLMTETTDDDHLLESAIIKHGRVVLPEYIDTDLRLVKPLQTLNPARAGHIHIEPGIDNTAREVFHSLYYHNEQLPSLTSVMYDMVSGDRFIRRQQANSARSDDGAEKIFQRDPQKINFYGPSGRFRRISLADVVSGDIPQRFFHDKIVLVGLTVSGIVDEIATPFSQARNRMAGVEVHANILNNLLDKSSVRDVADWQRICCVTLLSLVLALIFLKLDEKNAALLWLLSMLMVAATALFLFIVHNRWLPPTAFQISFSLVCLTTYLYRLDNAARRLDKEYETLSTLLEWENEMALEQTTPRGLFGFLSVGGINEKVQRQIRMTTKLVNLHTQLEIALITEQEALDNQVRLVEMLSHEYRTPLAIIRANLDILEMKDGAAGGALSTNFGKMKRAMSRLVEIMDISLERSRLKDKQLEAGRQKIHLGSLMQSLMEEARELWTERKLHFDLIDCDECIIEGDSSLLKTAILNLIDNAIKYSTENEPVQVSLTGSKREALIQVQNHGRVILGDDLGRVFDKYFRGAGSGNTRGAGLGLYLVRKIIEQHEGSVALDSDESGNTVASIRLPLG